MRDQPFHVAGSTFASRPAPSLDILDNALRSPSSIPATGSRRRRLWELAHKCHCPIVGVCFGVDELRGLMGRVVHVPRLTGNYVLHTSAVAACESRCPLSELLHKTLEKRYRLAIRQFSTAKDGVALQKLWQAALASGSGVPAALWAAWTHPACNKTLEQDIYADIHMLQHQVGTGTRADLGALQALREENAQLRNRLTAAQRDTEALRAEKIREGARLAAQIADLRTESAGKEAWAAGLAGQLTALREAIPDLKERQSLLRRASDAEAKAIALTARLTALECELERRQRAISRHETVPPGPPATNPAVPEHLEGKCILCVGGRSGAVDAYRQLVESRGGRFLHHDGGLEESLHRIDTALAAADLVICQAGCISHNAYWRVKEQCKRTGKRCIFLRTAGVSSFARSVGAAGRSKPAAVTAPAGPDAALPESPAEPFPR